MRFDYIRTIRQLDHLIKIKGTGSPGELAGRLCISRTCLYGYINKMKEAGAPIKYDTYRCTYYYEEEGSFKVDFAFSKDEIPQKHN